MKKAIQSTTSLFILFCTIMSWSGNALAVEPRYIVASGLTSSLNISKSGAASCTGTVTVWPGYTTDLKVELKRDGETIHTWSNSGSGTVTAGGTYYVTSGHEYVVTTTATVYNGYGNEVESPSTDSATRSY